MTNRLNVLYQFNEKYVPYAGVSLTSLLENNREIEKITIYILPERISNNSEKMLRKLAESYHREIVFIDTEKLIGEMQA